MDNQNPAAPPPVQAVPLPVNPVQPNTIQPAVGFPSINQLFQDSWQTFTHSILGLFLLNILGLVIYAGLGILGVAIFILSGAGSSLLQQGFEKTMLNLVASPQALTITIIIAVVFTIISAIIGSILQISSILIVDSQGKASIGNSLKKSFGLLIPLMLIGILTFILTFGALFVFILPAILFGYLLAFAQFEVILNNQKWTSALKRSVLLVSKHFGAILIRLILPVLIQIGFAIITNILSKIDPSVAILIGIVSFIINLFWGWFILAYIITLYKQARAGLEQEPSKGILWMWVIAIIGWIIAALIFFAGWKIISAGILKNLLTPPVPTNQNINLTPPKFNQSQFNKFDI